MLSNLLTTALTFADVWGPDPNGPELQGLYRKDPQQRQAARNLWHQHAAAYLGTAAKIDKDGNVQVVPSASPALAMKLSELLRGVQAVIGNIPAWLIRVSVRNEGDYDSYVVVDLPVKQAHFIEARRMRVPAEPHLDNMDGLDKTILGQMARYIKGGQPFFLPPHFEEKLPPAIRKQNDKLIEEMLAAEGGSVSDALKKLELSKG